MEAQRAVWIAHEDAIEDQGVKMEVRVHRPAETLDAPPRGAGGDQGVKISKAGAAWAKCEGLRVTMRLAPFRRAKVACSES